MRRLLEKAACCFQFHRMSICADYVSRSLVETELCLEAWKC